MVKDWRRLAAWELWLARWRMAAWFMHAFLVLLLIGAVISLSVEGLSRAVLGLFLITLPIGIVIDLMHLALKQKRRQIEENSAALGSPITYATVMLLERSQRRERYLWYYLLRETSVTFVVRRLGVTRLILEQQLPRPPEYSTWLASASQLAKSQTVPMAPKHLFEVLQTDVRLAAVWQGLGITDRERAEVWAWFDRLRVAQWHAELGFADKISLAGGIGRDWTAGYTRTLEEYAVNLSSEIGHGHREVPVVGHLDEQRKIIEYLCRERAHNVVLVGDEGIGRHRLVYNLAGKFASGDVPLNLKYKHVYLLDTGKLISGGTSQEVEGRVTSVLQEAATVGNVILVIPDLELLVSQTDGETLGTVDASPILTEFLQSSAVQIVAITTPDAYYRFVKPNPALESNLLTIEIKEIGPSEALVVMEDEVGGYENRSGRIFTYQALAKIIEIAERHVHDKPYPEKAIELMDAVAGNSLSSGQRLIFGADVERIIGEKLKIPIGTVSATERATLENLENMIKSRIVGQDEAVRVVANALRRARTGLHSGKRPIGSFLFLGPTGVGKTEMAKTIAAIYYQDERAFIRLDMSEYQTADSIDNLIGSRTTTGNLTTAVTDQPFSVVLLDEIEKADVGIRNLFLQILDDGRITDGFGHKVDFTNSMVIATSNAGAQFIREAVEHGVIDAKFKPQLLDYLQTSAIFSPEWLNRFDSVVVFLPLSSPEIRQVARLQVAELVGRLKTHNINLTIADDVYDVLVAHGYDPQFGARPMRRAIQDIVETALAKDLLADTTSGIKNIALTKATLEQLLASPSASGGGG